MDANVGDRALDDEQVHQIALGLIDAFADHALLVASNQKGAAEAGAQVTWERVIQVVRDLSARP